MASEAMEFDPSMKKKKTSSGRKKSVAFDDYDTAQPAGKLYAETLMVADERCRRGGRRLVCRQEKEGQEILKDASAFDDDNGDVPASAGALDPAEAAAEGGDADLDFTSLKKKKKKRVIDTEDAELEAKLKEAGIIDDRDQELDGDDPFGKVEGDEPRTVSDDRKAEEEAWLKSDRDYTYEEVMAHWKRQ
jgi:hypothetical protein